MASLVFLSASVSVHPLDQPDGADGDQILDADAGVFELPGDVDHQTQVVLDEGLADFRLLAGVVGQVFLLLFRGQRRGQALGRADVIDGRQLTKPQLFQKLPHLQGKHGPRQNIFHPCFLLFIPKSPGSLRGWKSAPGRYR